MYVYFSERLIIFYLMIKFRVIFYELLDLFCSIFHYTMNCVYLFPLLIEYFVIQYNETGKFVIIVNYIYLHI